jgi:hypothetical protein
MAAGISTVQGDFTCFGVFALCPHNELVVLDWFHGRIDGTRQIPTLKAYWSRHRAERIGVEAVAYQWTYRKVSGAPARARDYDALQSSPSRHVLVLILARRGAPNCFCRASCLPPPSIWDPAARTFAFPFGVRQVFGSKDACRDKCSVRCDDDACRDKCSVLCGDGSCKLNPQRRCHSRPTRMRRGA